MKNVEWMKETYPNPVEERKLQELNNIISGLPLDTLLFNDDHYYGTIPPTFAEWISEPVFECPPGERYMRCWYRIFKNSSGTYTMQDIGNVDSINVATGDFEFIVEKHKEYTGREPVFLKKLESIT
jgi:hypothetical protein